MARCKLTCVGTAPLLMHNSQMANPLHPLVKQIKAISGKRRKTDEDYETMARLDHAGSLYFDKEAGPYLPASHIRKSLVEAARKTKQGKEIEQGVFVDTLVNPLAYRGPRTIDELWANPDFVHMAMTKVQTARTLRARPIFRDWAVDAVLTYDTEVIDFAELERIATTAGTYIGLGDWRPLHGRFTATMEKLPDREDDPGAA